MSLTLLEIVQQATGELGLSVPTSVVGNPSLDTIQQYYLLNGLGSELLRKDPWENISVPYIFQVSVATITGNTTLNSLNLTNASSISGIDTTYQVAGTGINQATYVNSAPSGSTIPLSQPATSTNIGATYTLTKVKYAMPAGFDRQIDCTHWDKSKHWQMLGPESPQQWEWLLSGYISTGPRIRYRIFQGYFQIWPAVGSAEVLGFEYISNYWANSSGGTQQSSFLADTDTCIYPDRLMVIGLKHKFYSARGLGDQYREEYENELSEAKANDKGSPTLAMAPQASGVLITWNNIPDSGYGQS